MEITIGEIIDLVNDEFGKKLDVADIELYEIPTSRLKHELLRRKVMGGSLSGRYDVDAFDAILNWECFRELGV